ncbi:MAG TPA: FAD synthase [Rickettsia endosymbiont of Bembidion nr. Transversale]|nr:FAD synthase [Rickettsia endosymbiont of Stiretrus anchorago]HJD66119.1 FAD synthase [Rickettsia endosymbiont of Bembidion nr. Transversale]
MFRLFLFLLILTNFTSCSFNNQGVKPSKIEYYENIFSNKKCFPNSKIVLVGGCFDVLHYGHLEFLHEAKKQGKYLIVALEPDETIIKYKKRKPIHNQLQRAKILSSLTFVDKVLMLPELKGFNDYALLVQNICPSVIAVTKHDPQLTNKQTQAELINARVIEVIELIQHPNIGTFSTSNIINSI